MSTTAVPLETGPEGNLTTERPSLAQNGINGSYLTELDVSKILA
jgi:hypothetical protein